LDTYYPSVIDKRQTKIAPLSIFFNYYKALSFMARALLYNQVTDQQETYKRRNFMKKITLTLLAVITGLFLTSQVFAWGPGAGKGFGPCRGAALEQLNLTDNQKTKIENLQDEHFKATKPLQEKIFDKSVELQRLWLQANPDKNKITAAQKELRGLRDQMEDKATALRLNINSVLTPEQKEKLANSGWGRGHGFGPRGAMRHHGESGPAYGAGMGPGLGMGMCQ
jgi:Spy/CpxP family protein refolding chaperone